MKRAFLFGGVLVFLVAILGSRRSVAPQRPPVPPPTAAARPSSPDEIPIGPGAAVEFRADCWGAKTATAASTARRLQKDGDADGLAAMQRAGVAFVVRAGEKGVVIENDVSLARVELDGPGRRIAWVRILDVWPIVKGSP